MCRVFLNLLPLTVLVLLSSCFFQPLPFDEKEWVETVENTDAQDLYINNYNDGEFFNPWLAPGERTFSRFLRWRFSQTASYSEEARNNRPENIPYLIERIEALDPSSDFIVWIGHATFLIRIQGEYWLTDPMFSDRALLPKRITPPAIRANELLRLKGKLNVVISHNHYDHLDEKSLVNLPENTSFYVPKGLGTYIASRVSGSVTEMNWWDEIALSDGTKLTCLPAQHWSRRFFQGYNETLWGSYMIEKAGTIIYFGGDSGYFKGYREIGKKFNSIDYALLPITAYEPRWFMHYPHMDTQEAIRAFHDLGAVFFIPTQWGTFHLGDNPPGLPALDMKRDIKEMDLDPAPFLILDIGEIRLM